MHCSRSCRAPEKNMPLSWVNSLPMVRYLLQERVPSLRKLVTNNVTIACLSACQYFNDTQVKRRALYPCIRYRFVQHVISWVGLISSWISLSEKEKAPCTSVLWDGRKISTYGQSKSSGFFDLSNSNDFLIRNTGLMWKPQPEPPQDSPPFKIEWD